MFAIILPAVAEMMDERDLSASEAMKDLRRFLGEGEQPAEVNAAMERLTKIEDEGELRFMLGQECMRALKTKV